MSKLIPTLTILKNTIRHNACYRKFIIIIFIFIFIYFYLYFFAKRLWTNDRTAAFTTTLWFPPQGQSPDPQTGLCGRQFRGYGT